MGFLSGKKLRKVLSSVRQAEAKPYDGVKESKKALIAELQGSQPGEELPQRFELEASLPIKGSPRCSPSEESPAVEDARKRLIIGIDFGTTYSGVAYCFPDKRNAKPRAVVNWPGAAHGSAPKIPTLISYDKQDPGIFKWGALVDKKSDAIVGVKLLLDPSQKSPSYLPARNVKKDMKLLPKPPVDIAADFLRVLNAHAMSQIEQATPAGAMEGREKEYVLSGKSERAARVRTGSADEGQCSAGSMVGRGQRCYPGSMSSILGPRPAFERAGREAYNFVQAAEKAGISPITLIKEPEAAALYALRDEDYAVEPKDCFVICDAGGGTVDLISYEVGSTKPTLEVHEVIPGTGATVGSLGLNKRFAEAVQSLFDEDDWPGVKRSEDFRHAERKFEDEVKKGFQGRPDEEYLIYFPRVGLADDPENGIVSNVWTMKIHRDDVRAIFEPVVTDILRLIKDQVQSVKLKRRNDKVAGIVLVGGFGSSQYLKHRVQTEHPHIHVFQPADAWAAIVKGAVLSKLPGEAIVSSTAAVRHYGIEVSSLYDEMVWYINIGDNIRRDQTIQLPVYRCVPVDSDAKAFLFYSQLIEAEDEIAPLYRSEGQKIKVCCRLKSDLSGVPRSKFNKKIANQRRRAGEEGKQYWEVQYNLVIAFKPALMSFSLELDGETIGSVEAHFAH
ncbi:hypothetical protein PWT90_02178 [Aphanocladium album]|nr:hypothetical protein PWT90_02178 [Aphanocladium album]